LSIVELKLLAINLCC